MLGNIFSPLFAKIFAGLAVALLIATAFQTIRVEHLKRVVAVLRIDLTQARARTEAEIAQHKASKQAYREAQAEAERMEKERLARITAEQERINDDRVQSYQRRLADARRTAEQLRNQARAGAGGKAGGVSMPAADDTRRTSGTADHPELSEQERLIATEQAIQLDELITAVEQHMRIDPNVQ